MEADAYSSFISVDMELSTPLFSIGFINGTQYADLEDALVATSTASDEGGRNGGGDGGGEAGGGTQGAERSGGGSVAVSASARRFRHSLEVLKRGVLWWEGEGGVSLLLHCGN
eukprot:6180057-Pleurochrysis_carterae.AAC.1